MSDALETRNRYFGRVILLFAGAATVRLADGRRATIPAREVSEYALELAPGEQIEVSIMHRADGSLSAFDPSRT